MTTSRLIEKGVGYRTKFSVEIDLEEMDGDEIDIMIQQIMEDGVKQTNHNKWICDIIRMIKREDD